MALTPMQELEEALRKAGVKLSRTETVILGWTLEQCLALWRRVDELERRLAVHEGDGK